MPLFSAVVTGDGPSTSRVVIAPSTTHRVVIIPPTSHRVVIVPSIISLLRLVAFARHVPLLSAVVTSDGPSTSRVVIVMSIFLLRLIAFSRNVPLFPAVVASDQGSSLAFRLVAVSGYMTRLVAVVANASVRRGWKKLQLLLLLL